MFEMLKQTIIGPNPYPWPRRKWDAEDILLMAILYLVFLIFTKGIAATTACTMAGKRYNIAEDVLRGVAKEKEWL